MTLKKRGEGPSRDVLQARDGTWAVIERLLSDEMSLAEVSRAVLELTIDLTGSTDALVGLIDPFDSSMHCSAMLGSLGKPGEIQSRKIVFENRADGKFVSVGGHQLNVRHAFFKNEPLDQPVKLGPGSGELVVSNFLNSPAIMGGNSLGLLALANKRGGFTRDDLEVMRQVSGLYGLAVMRHSMGDRLRSSERRYRDILNDALDMVHILDSTGQIVDTNPVELQTMGFTQEDYVGRNLLDLVHPVDLESARDILRMVYNGQKIKGFQTGLIKADGSTIRVEMNLVPQTESGKTVAVTVFSRDVTRRLQEEEALREAHFNLEKAVETRTRELQDLIHKERETKLALLNMMEDLELTTNQAMAATRAKSLFLANMSHEIRTPINAVLGLLHLAQDLDLPSELSQYLQKSEHAALSLRGIIDDILDFSKIEAGKMELNPVDFAVESMLQRVVEMVGFRSAQKGLELVVHVAEDVPEMLRGDSARIGQILTNLCTNAIKFTEEGVIEVFVNVSEPDSKQPQLEFSVRDSGIGIPEDQIEHLFDEFNQVDASYTRLQGGTGLGLSISARIAEMMGGRCWLERSAPGEGSLFCFTVILEQSSESAAHRNTLDERLAAVGEDCRVLVLDGCEAVRKQLGGLLRGLGFSCGLAADGEDVSRLLEQFGRPFDVVLLDQDWAKSERSDLIARIRASGKQPSATRIVILSEIGSLQSVPGEVPSHADALLFKPVLKTRLIESLLAVLDDPDQRLSSRVGARGNVLPDLSGVRFLLVEDNEVNRQVALEILERAGASVSEARDGEQAVELFRNQSFDGVLMDIQMPRLDGIQATRRIRALTRAPDDRFARVPIIAMTAHATAADRASSLEAGMNDYLTKPVDLERLSLVLRRWVLADPGERNGVSAEEPAPEPAADPAPDTGLQGFIEVEEGVTRLAGNRDLFLKLLGRFADEYGDSVGEIRALIESGKLEEAEGKCHGLKGVAGNLSAQDLFQVARAVDDRLKEAQTPTAALLEDFESAMTHTLADIRILTADRNREGC